MYELQWPPELGTVLGELAQGLSLESHWSRFQTAWTWGTMQTLDSDIKKKEGDAIVLEILIYLRTKALKIYHKLPYLTLGLQRWSLIILHIGRLPTIDL